MWCLLQASPLQISPFGVYLLRRSLRPQGYLHPHDTGLPNEICYRKARSGAVGSGATGPTTADPIAAGSSDGATLAPATPILWELASNAILAGGATAK